MNRQEDDSVLNYPAKHEMVLDPFYLQKENSPYFPIAPASAWQRRAIHAGLWIAGFSLLTLFINFLKPIEEALARASINLVCLMTIFYGTRLLIFYYYEKKRYRPWLVINSLLIILIGVLRTWFDLRVLKATAFRNGNLDDFDTLKIFKLFCFFLLIGLLFTTLASLYYIAKNRRVLEQQYFKLKIQQVETHLNFLKAQVNPHFLFNTLNNIYAAAELKDPHAPGMILQLSQLLRYITYTVQQKKVNLEEEWEQIENYVKLFCSRNPGGNYPVTMKVDGELCNTQIPPMLLLPIVENAIKYSDMNQADAGCYLKIRLQCSEKQIDFQVVNTYCAAGQQADIKGGIGNHNIRQRLQLEFPGQHRLTTEKTPRDFTTNLTLILHDK